jgi:hypothetical protein
MGGTCGTYRGEDRCIKGFGRKNLEVRDHLEDVRTHGKIILLWFFRK